MSQAPRLRTGSDRFLRLRISIRGAVQGVGFRPFIYRLASDFGLSGWVNNNSQGVFIEVEGREERLRNFLLRIEAEKPDRAFIQSLESTYLDPAGYTTFEIRTSENTGPKRVLVLPDVAVCTECLNEVRDPANRRYRYPFTNCTNCGPRYSIIRALPYDRASTTMNVFAMCVDCQREYDDPLDRRFHAQPNACPACGPHLELWDESGTLTQVDDAALVSAVEAIRQGSIVAVKGLGGFHLVVDARNAVAVEELRTRKRRDEKPLAVMYPSLEMILEDCEVADVERRLLVSPESPIVLLRKRVPRVADNVAPANPYLGVMLPYTPLHQLLMADLGFPVVATSGNLSDEPICIDELEAVERLRGIANRFLVHDRPIVRHVDDSVVRVILGREMVLRRARGYAPLPIAMQDGATEVLAVGAHLKNAVAAAIGPDAFLSQHVGDLETAQAYDAFLNVISGFKSLYEFSPDSLVCDAHPDYRSTQYARQTGLPVLAVQHHYAHVLSCMAENGLSGPVLGVSWDGTGFGPDHTVWGGEFLRILDAAHLKGCACHARPVDQPFQRVAHFRTFRLPGGEKSIKEPRRTAIGLLYELYGEKAFEMRDLAPVADFSEANGDLIRTMLTQELNSPVTSSVGRLFDAVSSIAGLRQQVRFEGQAAMELEFAIDRTETDDRYPFDLVRPSTTAPLPAVIIDWSPMVRALLRDVRSGTPAGTIATRFHNGLVEAIVAVARRIGEEKIALTGGCFQNKYLTERAVRRLEAEGFRVYWHQRVPPNDGGIALGQLAAARLSGKE